MLARHTVICSNLNPTLEIDPEVDFDSRRAVYFRQMRYGLFVCRNLLASGFKLIAFLPDPYGVAYKRHGLNLNASVF